jgi:hypothetical protein
MFCFSSLNCEGLTPLGVRHRASLQGRRMQKARHVYADERDSLRELGFPPFASENFYSVSNVRMIMIITGTSRDVFVFLNDNFHD